MTSAKELYQTFNQFPVDLAYKIPLLWPEPRDLCLLGLGTGIDYRSDKWTGTIIDYTHPHTTPIVVLAPTLPSYPQGPTPPSAPQGSQFALLGRDAFFCLQINYINALTGQSDKIDFLQYPLLPIIAAHPNGNTLIILYPGTIPIIVTGPGLQVTDRGIVG